MKFISLGRHCDVAFNIKKYTNNDNPTHFFDWVRTDFKCVLFILKLTNFRSLFNIRNFKIDKQSYAHDNQICITLKNFERDNLTMLFHHDIPLKDYSVVEMCSESQNFITKYHRRYDRLIELIKSDKKIIFIHRATIQFDYENDIECFHKKLRNINKDIIFCLVILIEEEENEIFIKNEKYLKINLSYFINKNIEFSWERLDVDWKSVFELIKTNAFL